MRLTRKELGAEVRLPETASPGLKEVCSPGLKVCSPGLTYNFTAVLSIPTFWRQWTSATGNERVERLERLADYFVGWLPDKQSKTLFELFSCFGRIFRTKYTWELLARAKDENLAYRFNNFNDLQDFGLLGSRHRLEKSQWTPFCKRFLKMPRRAPRYNPTALRIWRMLKRMGITSPQGIFLSLVFWSLFICLTYFTYTELNKFLAKIEARKLGASKLDPSFIINNETLAASVNRVRQWDAFGIIKRYWNNNSNVENLVNYVKGKTPNISAYIHVPAV